ncbi:clathrin light chain 1 [Physcomitrium patens]|uniref:Clathrin light chain n=1 Tax=Physcomitrium patens TaxID=3218 RepID=A0A2K1KB66_PHYPA|nr:clathrin light chain 2-like [Physcomitrium patens]XP_024380280.1 clathrin light chain 2-like [Physcomitrium patens]XP_024380309.1 clathrin light chain 2-like [Physcomitrium patens]XP_024380310.1 clathrin light chain 2-like [Physcomitrium patens]PNR51019.1 hypothetical protein PHYPA_010205 [Physcomitrium patens]PNR51021.1 hypothetical protein PHYPA_010207 [Physcomitrium patens]|eukprot:XP_024380279.1 clathrin light chain 2-like [Physcomitrella patens]
MAYDGYSGGADDLSTYSSFDDSARFDSSRLDSARFDSSFRAPDDYKPDHFGMDDNREGFDDFKGASHGYDHPAPIYENEESAPGMPGMYGFGMPGSESPSGFPKGEYSAPGFTDAEYTSNPAGGSYNKELDEDLFGGDNGGGPMLPPPEEMQEEGAILRQWKRENMQRLQEKERVEKEKLQQIMDDADEYKEKHKAKRESNREAKMKENREKEMVYHADQEHFHKTADKQYWKAVTELVPKELPASLEPKSRQMKEKKEKKSTFVALPGPKPGRATDLGRFRQVLLKLKHNPPAHMIPPPPPPAKAEVKEGEKGAKDGAAKEGEKEKENGAAVAAPAADAAKAPEAPAAQPEPELIAAA